METRPPITTSLERLVKKGIPQKGKVCTPVPGSDVLVCISHEQSEERGSQHSVVQTSIEGRGDALLSQQRFDILTDDKRAQVETHIFTDPEMQGNGYASGLIYATNAVINRMVLDFSDVFRGKRVQGVIRDEATNAYRRNTDAVAERTSWSSRRAKELGYRSFDDERGPIWIKPYGSSQRGSGIGSILSKFLRH